MKGKSALKGRNILNIGSKTPDERAQACLKEMAEVLKKYNCSMDVAFKQERVLDTSALLYQINVIANK